MTKLKNIREPFISTTGVALKSLQERVEHHCGGDPWELGKNGDCVEWNGPRTESNYGFIHISKRRADQIGYPCPDDREGIAVQIHRMVYMMEHGLIEDDKLVVMHSCDNRPCCSPYHLSLGTRGDNHRDAYDKGRLHPTDPNWSPPSVLPESERNYLNSTHLERFLSKIDGGEKALFDDGCAVWTGNADQTRNPYFHVDGTMKMASHVVLKHYTGFDAREQSAAITRSCENTQCISLAHMKLIPNYNKRNQSIAITDPNILAIIEHLNDTSSNFLHKESRTDARGWTINLTEYQRFINGIDIADNWDDCWNWRLSKTNKGYGKFCMEDSRNREKILAHRVSYQLWNGPIPDDLVIRHMCHNKSCVNPRHLKIGTPQDNKMDSYRDGAIKTFFSIEQMQEIIAYAYGRGWDPSKFSKQELKPLARKLRREIAEMYNLEYDRKVQSTVNNLLGDRTFTFIERPWKP